MRLKKGQPSKGIAVVLLSVLASAALAAQDFQIRARVDLVVVPVTVESRDGLVAGLSKEDFVLYEDGKPQTITNFTIDPAPLSSVLIIDSGLSADSFSKVRNSIPILTGHFSESDEVAVYRYDKHIAKLADFTSDHVTLETALKTLNDITPSATGMVTGPFSMPGPSVNGVPILPSTQLRIHVPPSETKRLNDVIFTAAEDLGTRAPERRKVIIVVSDGQNRGSDHSYGETRDRLHERDIQVYAIGMDHSFFARGLSVLSSYADDTGGNACFVNSQSALEDCMARNVEEARNQYVLGFVSNQKPPAGVPVFREIRVDVVPDHYKTRHRKGYFQAP